MIQEITETTTDSTFVESALTFLSNWWWVGLILLIIPFSKLIFGWVFIGEEENGIVIRKWGGGTLPEGRIVGTQKESGTWAQMLPPGLKFGYWPWMYQIKKQPITIVEQGQIAYVEAIDGAAQPQGDIVSRKAVECNDFTDGAAFLANGGVKGYQSQILANGKFRINTELFKVTVTNAIVIPTNKIGVVTTRDGKPLPNGEIAGPPIEANHKNFQDVHAFLSGGGFKGVQEDVLTSGVYHIHPKFATVQIEEMCRVEVGYVAVVNSFIGAEGGSASDTSGDDFEHGNIVPKGHKGIWDETLDPGFHPINPMLMDVLMVPTTNIVLKWADDVTGGEHEYDEKLKTIRIRSIDGFDFTMEVDQVINISHKDAPKVIARFGTVQNMIDQVLEPTVGNYFRNAAQTSEALKFVFERSERQEEARNHIEGRLNLYNIVCVDTLIGDIDPPARLMDILKDQQEADQQKEMWIKKEESEKVRQQFVAAETAADKEKELTASSYDKQIETQKAEALAEKAKGQRESDKIQADGEAYVLKMVGEAKAYNTREVGNAEAEVIEKKTVAMGQSEYASVLVAEALAKGGIEIVPKVLIQGSGEGAGGTMVDALLGTEFLKKQGVFADKAKEVVAEVPASDAKPEDQESSTQKKNDSEDQ